MHESSLAQEFVLEGQQIAVRKSILQVLLLRFGEEEASEFTATLERITDLDRFDELFNLAIKARRISQFRRAMSADRNEKGKSHDANSRSAVAGDASRLPSLLRGGVSPTDPNGHAHRR